MKNRAVLTSEEAVIESSNPILVISKASSIGESLVSELAKDFLVVYATDKKNKNISSIIHISYKAKILQIPNNTFSNIFLILEEEGEDNELLPSLIQKAKESSARLFVVIPSKVKEGIGEKIIKLKSSYPLTLFVTGDIFGTGYGKVDELIEEVEKSGMVTLSNDGLEESYPVHIDNVVKAILKGAFLTENTTQVLLLYENYPTTEIAIARAITKVFPDAKVQFKRKRKEKVYRFMPDGQYALDASPLFEKIKVSGKIEKKEEGRVKKQKASKLKKTIVFLAFLMLLTPFLLTALLGGLGIILAKSAVTETKSGKLNSAAKKFSIAKNTFSLAGESAVFVKSMVSLLGQAEKGDELITSLRSGELITEAGESAVLAGEKYREVLMGNSIDPAKDIQTGSLNLKRALTLVQKIEIAEGVPKEIKDEILTNKEYLLIANHVVDILPEIIGVTRDKKYLMVFQNNLELRPGGGFIGSYGLVTMSKGVVKDVVISDVYDADGRLKGHVEPPYPLRRFAGIKHWYLRDSNFNVNPVENAQKAMYFLELETGEKVDGVITLDTEVLKKLVHIYGPIFLPQYNQTVTSENIVMLTQVESQDNFFPGSTQKKDFLNALHTELLKKVQREKGKNYDNILDIIKEVLREKHLFFTLKDEGLQKILSQANVSGMIKDKEQQDGVFNDYLQISEANIGGTKGNYYLERAITQNVKLTTEKALGSLKLTYNNKSKSDSKFGGGYNGYLQIVIPEEANLTSLLIDGKENTILPAVTIPEVYEAKSFKEKEGVEVVREGIGSKSILGFNFNIPVNTIRTIEIRYEIALGEDMKEYKLMTIKQPGTLQDPYLLRVYYPESKKSTKIAGLKEFGNRAEFRGELDQDKEFSIVFDEN